MITVNIKIENNNLQKARTEVEALLVYIDTLAKTYPTEFVEAKEVKKTVRKRATTKKPAVEPEVKDEEVKETKKVSEPVKEEKTVTEATLTLADLTALAKKAVAGSDRDTVKDLIASYGKGKLSSVEEDKFEALAEELKALA